MEKDEAEASSLELFHPLIKEWFLSTYGRPTDIQQESWPMIAKGEHCLVTAPTGGGKTLTAFLWTLNRLISGDLPTGCMSVLYISPLKALGSDVRKNLLVPLSELRQLFRERGTDFPEIRVQTRSGDTPQNERQKMLRRPPEILITTPESFNILLSSHGGRSLFGHLDTLILDEIHSLIGTKRGVYLISAVERAAIEWGEYQRIALSATVRPLSAARDFISGYEIHSPAPDTEKTTSFEPSPHKNSIPMSSLSPEENPLYHRREVKVCSSHTTKEYQLQIMSPRPQDFQQDIQTEDSSPAAAYIQPADPDTLWESIAEQIYRFTQEHASTLVFANSRRLVEKIARLINESAGTRIAYAHHGSLSKELRLTVEAKLKKGELKAIVATNSLELGIDVGALDLVVLVQTPFSISSGVQKIGRAGHKVGSVSKGVLFPSHGLDIAKAATLVCKVMHHEIEELKPIRAPLDILAQIILSMTVIRSRNIDTLYMLIRGMEPFVHLQRRHYDLVIEMLAGKYANTRIRELQPRISIDRLENTISARKGAQHLLFLSGGTIPDRGQYDMRLSESGTKVGTLDEEFVWERNIGDRFELGTHTWEIKNITHNDVVVAPSSAAPNIIPFWRAEEYNRDFEFSEALLTFIEKVEVYLEDERLGPVHADPEFTRWAQENYGLQPEASARLAKFLKLQQRNSGAPLPTRHRILIEHIAEPFGPEGTHRVVLHTLWGGAVNRPFGLLLEAYWQKHYGYSPQIIAGNDAVLIALPEKKNIAADIGRLGAEEIEKLMRRKLEHTGLFGALFRENAGRALLLPRQGFNRRLPLWFNRLRAKKLLSAVYELKDFPVLLETWRSCIQDVFDMPHLQQVLDEIATGKIECREFATAAPSPFCDGIVYRQINIYMYADDTPEATGKSNLDEALWGSVLDSPSLRPLVESSTLHAFSVKIQRTLPGYAPTEPLEILEWVKERVMVPAGEWQTLLEAVARDGGPPPEEIENAIGDKLTTIDSTEGAQRVICAVEDQSALQELHAEQLAQYLRFYGPTAIDDIKAQLPYSPPEIEKTVQELIEAGDLVRGKLSSSAVTLQVCDRENLEILLRMQRSTKRSSFKALPAEEYPLFLARLQGLLPRGSTPEDFADRMERLIGTPIPYEGLEKWTIPARMHTYYQGWLDGLSAEEGLGWFGCDKKHIFLSYPDQLEFLLSSREAENSHSNEGSTGPLPSHRGKYSFFDIKDMSDKDTATLTEELWKALWAGKIANDSFAALRNGILSGFKPSSPSSSGPSSSGSSPPGPSQHSPHSPSPPGSSSSGSSPSGPSQPSSFSPSPPGSSPSGSSQHSYHSPSELSGARQPLEPSGPGGFAGNRPRNEHRSARSVRSVGDGQSGGPGRTRRRGSRSSYRGWKATRPLAGNWFSLAPYKPDSSQDLIESEELNRERVHLLLDRYGVVGRLVLQRELEPLQWKTIRRTLQRMEMSGEIVGGHFFEGIEGIQFASHEAVRLLSNWEHSKTEAEQDPIFWVNAADPASPCGLGLQSLPYTLPARTSSSYLLFHGSRLVLTIKRNGQELFFTDNPEHAGLQQYLYIFEDLCTRDFQPNTRITVTKINDVPVHESPYRTVLESFGFTRGYKGCVYHAPL